MTGIMQPDKSSRENIELFIESQEPEELKMFLLEHIEDILAVGASSDNRDHREAFLEAVQEFITNKIGHSQ